MLLIHRGCHPVPLLFVMSWIGLSESYFKHPRCSCTTFYVLPFWNNKSGRSHVLLIRRAAPTSQSRGENAPPKASFQASSHNLVSFFTTIPTKNNVHTNFRHTLYDKKYQQLPWRIRNAIPRKVSRHDGLRRRTGRPRIDNIMGRKWSSFCYSWPQEAGRYPAAFFQPDKIQIFSTPTQYVAFCQSFGRSPLWERGGGLYAPVICTREQVAVQTNESAAGGNSIRSRFQQVTIKHAQWSIGRKSRIYPLRDATSKKSFYFALLLAKRFEDDGGRGGNYEKIAAGVGSSAHQHADQQQPFYFGTILRV